MSHPRWSTDDDAGDRGWTYEATQAWHGSGGDHPGGGHSSSSSSSSTPAASAASDPIHWEADWSFRNEPYRQLHHQRGVMGHVRGRLLEGRDLQRSHWSALALGPVKHLGLSKAHGPVSSYCQLSLAWQQPPSPLSSSSSSTSRFNNNSARASTVKQPPPSSTSATSSTAAHSGLTPCSTTVTSPVIPRNDNPIWGDDCLFEFPLFKAPYSTMSDGRRLLLQVVCWEDATTVESLLPLATGSSKSDGDFTRRKHDDPRILGSGAVDVTHLLLGMDTATGTVVPPVLDVWIPLTLETSNDDDKNSNNNKSNDSSRERQQQEKLDSKPSAVDKKNGSRGGDFDDNPATSSPNTKGHVRILVSYSPFGLEPEQNDIIAMESFARRPLATTSCRPLVPPLRPLQVMERPAGSPWMRASYRARNGRLYQCRVHRNTIFVVERQSWVDAAHHWAALPVDLWMSTPVGQATAQVTGPVVQASKELLLPALLSLKLAYFALRTTTLASVSGVQALTATMWEEGTTSLTTSNHPARERDRQAAQQTAHRNAAAAAASSTVAAGSFANGTSSSVPSAATKARLSLV